MLVLPGAMVSHKMLPTKPYGRSSRRIIALSVKIKKLLQKGSFLHFIRLSCCLQSTTSLPLTLKENQ